MDTQKITYLTEKFGNNLKPDELQSLKPRMDAAPDKAFEPLNALTFKNKTATLLLSLFLGGLCAGRFYLGDWKFALLKIFITFALGIISSFIPVTAIKGIIGVALLIWSIIEIVLCYKRCTYLNYLKVFNCLKMYEGK